MSALQYHRRLFRNSLLLILGHTAGLCLALWGVWKLPDQEVIHSVLFFLALCFLHAARFHVSEAWKLHWLIGVDRIHENLFHHRNS